MCSRGTLFEDIELDFQTTDKENVAISKTSIILYVSKAYEVRGHQHWYNTACTRYLNNLTEAS